MPGTRRDEVTGSWRLPVILASVAKPPGPVPCEGVAIKDSECARVPMRTAPHVTWFELIDTHCIVSLAGKVVEGRTSHGSQAEHQAITVFHRGLLCEELLTRRLLSAASINSTRWRCAVVDTCPHIAARVFRSGQFASSDHLNQATCFCFVCT